MPWFAKAITSQFLQSINVTIHDVVIDVYFFILKKTLAMSRQNLIRQTNNELL